MEIHKSEEEAARRGTLILVTGKKAPGASVVIQVWSPDSPEGMAVPLH